MDSRARHDLCGGGFSADYAPDRRPRFTCSKCGETWTAGYSGQPYLDQCRASGTDNYVIAKRTRHD